MVSTEPRRRIVPTLVADAELVVFLCSPSTLLGPEDEVVEVLVDDKDLRETVGDEGSSSFAVRAGDDAVELGVDTGFFVSGTFGTGTAAAGLDAVFFTCPTAVFLGARLVMDAFDRSVEVLALGLGAVGETGETAALRLPPGVSLDGSSGGTGGAFSFRAVGPRALLATLETLDAEILRTRGPAATDEATELVLGAETLRLRTPAPTATDLVVLTLAVETVLAALLLRDRGELAERLDEMTGVVGESPSAPP